MLKIRKLDLSFDDENILKNLNFECKAGEITVITGHSGCGADKSRQRRYP